MKANLTLLSLILLTLASFAADATDTVEQEVEEVAEAEAETILIDIDLPGKDGTVTANDSKGYYATVLAYESIDLAAAEIAKQVIGSNSSEVKKVMILSSDADYEAIASYALIKRKLEAFVAKFEPYEEPLKDDDGNDIKVITLTPERNTNKSAIASIAIAGEVIGAAAEIASMFKKDITINSVDVTPDQAALRTLVTKYLLENSYNVHYPELDAVQTQLDLESGTIGTDLFRLIDVASRIEKALDQQYEEGGYKTAVGDTTKAKAEIAKLEVKKKGASTSELATIVAEIAKQRDIIEKNEAKVSQWNELSKKPKALISEFTKFSTTLVTVPEGQTMAPISQIGLVEATYGKFEGNYLYLKLLSSGGEQRITESTFSSAKIDHIGSVTCEFTYIEGKSSIKAVDVITKSIYDGDFKRVKSSSKRTTMKRPRLSTSN